MCVRLLRNEHVGIDTHDPKPLVQVTKEMDRERLEGLAFQSGGHVREEQGFSQETITQIGPLAR